MSGLISEIPILVNSSINSWLGSPPFYFHKFQYISNFVWGIFCLILNTLFLSSQLCNCLTILNCQALNCLPSLVDTDKSYVAKSLPNGLSKFHPGCAPFLSCVIEYSATKASHT